MLNQMCHEVLSTADISALRKARGFNQKETATRSTLETFFLSSIGLDAVMQTLSEAEIAALHLLSEQKEPASIAFFERLYGSARPEDSYYYGTLTQQYKETLADVRQNLVRKGLLVMAEVKTRSDSVQMERWRFYFPPEFVRYLPPIVQSPLSAAAGGEVRSQAVRGKLKEIFQPPNDAKPQKSASFALGLAQGSLMLNDQPFKASALVDWQQASWEAALAVPLPNDPAARSPAKAIQTILRSLQAGQWATPKQMTAALKIFSFGAKLPEVDIICDLGWKFGCLARLTHQGQSYYRDALSNPAGGLAAEPPAYQASLRFDPHEGCFLVNLETIPLEILEQVNALARLEAAHGQLKLYPDTVKLGRAMPVLRQSADAQRLAAWLEQHSTAFRQARQAVEAQWGKIVVHSNLLVARVRDLSLRVQLERTLGKNLIVLNTPDGKAGEYVAFPSAWLGEVEKTLKKSGFVIKEIRP